MDYLAFQRCLDFLAESDFSFEALVTDCHGSIAKHMKEKEENIKDFFDLWHLRKSESVITIF